MPHCRRAPSRRIRRATSRSHRRSMPRPPRSSRRRPNCNSTPARRLTKPATCAGSDRFPKEPQDRAGAGAAGRLLQPRQHAIPARAEDREEQSAGDDQDLGASREVLRRRAANRARRRRGEAQSRPREAEDRAAEETGRAEETDSSSRINRISSRQQDQKNNSKDQKNDPKNQQAGQNGQEPKDQQQQQQDQKNDSKDQKSDPKNQQAGQKAGTEGSATEQRSENVPRIRRAPRISRPAEGERRIKNSNKSRLRRTIPRIRRVIPRTSRPARMDRSRRIKNSRTRRRAVRPDPAKSRAAERSPGKKPSQGPAASRQRSAARGARACSAGGERREPGQMTKEEAQQLLDALKNDERKLPAMSDARPRRRSARRPTATAQRLVKHMNTPKAFQRHLLAGVCAASVLVAPAWAAPNRDHRAARSARSGARGIRAARRDHQRFAARGTERPDGGRSRDHAGRSAKLDASHQRCRLRRSQIHVSSHAEPRQEVSPFQRSGRPAAAATQPIAFRVDKGPSGQNSRSPRAGGSPLPAPSATRPEEDAAPADAKGQPAFLRVVLPKQELTRRRTGARGSESLFPCRHVSLAERPADAERRRLRSEQTRRQSRTDPRDHRRPCHTT